MQFLPWSFAVLTFAFGKMYINDNLDPDDSFRSLLTQ